MIGIFDSGFGGLAIHQAVARRRPDLSLMYLADQSNAPYGLRSAEEILELTRRNVARLFDAGCRLVILGCNTASAVALHNLQTQWLPTAYPGHNVLGIIVPTIEVATQVPWHVTTPIYPQKFNAQSVGVFATPRTVESGTYPVEINKRCPQMKVIQQSCPHLAGRVEAGERDAKLFALIRTYVSGLLAQTGGVPPDWVILGCTHFSLVKSMFQAALPGSVRIICQPTAVADSLDDYLQRHPEYVTAPDADYTCGYFTTGSNDRINPIARAMFGREVQFEAIAC